MSAPPKWLQEAADDALRALPPEALAYINKLQRENKTLKEMNAQLQERVTLNGV